MTDRHSGYVVTLREDIREDDAEPTLTALRMIHGVLSVKPIVGGIEVAMAEERAKAELRRRLLDLLEELR